MELGEIHFGKELGHALDALAEIGRHRSLTVSCQPLILELQLDVRSSRPAV